MRFARHLGRLSPGFDVFESVLYRGRRQRYRTSHSARLSSVLVLYSFFLCGLRVVWILCFCTFVFADLFGVYDTPVVARVELSLVLIRFVLIQRLHASIRTLDYISPRPAWPLVVLWPEERVRRGCGREGTRQLASVLMRGAKSWAVVVVGGELRRSEVEKGDATIGQVVHLVNLLISTLSFFLACARGALCRFYSGLCSLFMPVE